MHPRLNIPAFVILVILLTTTVEGCISEKTTTSGVVTVKYEGVSEEVASALAEALSTNAILQINTATTITLKKQETGHEITIPTIFNNSVEMSANIRKIYTMLAMSLSLHVFGNEPVTIRLTSNDGETVIYTARGICDDVNKFACNIIKYTKNKRMGELSILYTPQVSDEQAQKLGEVLIDVIGEPERYMEIYIDKYNSDTFQLSIPTVFTSANELSEGDKEFVNMLATKFSREVFDNKRVLLRLRNQNLETIYTGIGTSS